MNAEEQNEQNSDIIVLGTANHDAKVDFYHHVQFGGCGTVFKALPPRYHAGGDGEYYPDNLTCPGCKKTMKISPTSDPKGGFQYH